MLFSIICQYSTNIYSTNIAAHATNDLLTQNGLLDTVIVNSANIVKAIALDKFGTNWVDWNPADICYEMNLNTGNQGIYLVQNSPSGFKQTNISSYFGNFTNMFSEQAASVFLGTNYAVGTNFATGSTNSTLPVIGGWSYYKGTTNFNITNIPTSTDFVFSDNLAYLTLATSNLSFSLFGLSQGSLVDVGGYYNKTLYGTSVSGIKADEAYITGAGTFFLNATTNIYRSTLPSSIPDANFFVSGLAHGTVYVMKPYYLGFGPPEGP